MDEVAYIELLMGVDLHLMDVAWSNDWSELDADGNLMDAACILQKLDSQNECALSCDGFGRQFINKDRIQNAIKLHFDVQKNQDFTVLLHV